jgi:hypothetical protein
MRTRLENPDRNERAGGNWNPQAGSQTGRGPEGRTTKKERVAGGEDQNKNSCLSGNVFAAQILSARKMKSAQDGTWLRTQAVATKNRGETQIRLAIPASAGGVDLGTNTEALYGKTKNGNEAKQQTRIRKQNLKQIGKLRPRAC